jgi:hypothetical protein
MKLPKSKRLFVLFVIIIVSCHYLNKSITAQMENLGIAIVTTLLGSIVIYIINETKRPS